MGANFQKCECKKANFYEGFKKKLVSKRNKIKINNINKIVLFLKKETKNFPKLF